MAKKSSKKLTPNQAEWNRIVKNAKATYNRRLKEGFETVQSFEDIIPRRPQGRITRKMLNDIRDSAKSINDAFYTISENGERVFYSTIPRSARANLKQTGFARYKETTPEGVHVTVNISVMAGLNHRYIINTATLAFGNFMDANRIWITDSKSHAGFEYIVEQLKQERHQLQNLYGTARGDTVFTIMLNAIGVIAGTLTSEEANNVTAAQRWLDGFYDERQSSVEEMMKLNEDFGG